MKLLTLVAHMKMAAINHVISGKTILKWCPSLSLCFPPHAGSQSEPHLSRSFHGVQSPVDCSQGWYTSSAATDSEALIRVELDLISPACPSNTTQDEQLCIANVQFNNLDIVGKLAWFNPGMLWTNPILFHSCMFCVKSMVPFGITKL